MSNVRPGADAPHIETIEVSARLRREEPIQRLDVSGMPHEESIRADRFRCLFGQVGDLQAMLVAPRGFAQHEL